MYAAADAVASLQRAKVREEWQEQVATVRAWHAEAAATLQSSHIEEVARLRDEHLANLHSSRATSETALAQVQQRHKVEVGPVTADCKLQTPEHARLVPLMEPQLSPSGLPCGSYAVPAPALLSMDTARFSGARYKQSGRHAWALQVDKLKTDAAAAAARSAERCQCLADQHNADMAAARRRAAAAVRDGCAAAAAEATSVMQRRTEAAEQAAAAAAADARNALRELATERRDNAQHQGLLQEVCTATPPIKSLCVVRCR